MTIVQSDGKLFITIMLMKKIYRNAVLSAVSMAIFLIIPCHSNAERIYHKDGRISDEKITYRNRGVVWYRQSTGLLGIDIRDIEKIENDDGSVSKYDYKVISRKIQACIKENRYDDAAALCSALLETIPDNARIHYLRGVLYQKLGNAEKAEQDYSFLVKNKLADASILNNLGTIYATNQRYKEAVDLFIKAAAEDPNITQVHDNIAQVSLATDNYNRAADEYEKVIRRDPNNANALYNLGIIYMSKGRYEKAKEFWERALFINPEDGDTKKALEYIRTKDK